MSVYEESKDIEKKLDLITKKLSESIKRSDLSYVELEKKTGIAKSSIQRYATGKTKKIPLTAVQKIAEATGVSAAWIMGWETKELNSVTNVIPLPDTKQVPLLGTIACGEPILAAENIECSVDMPDNIRADFALRCKGDSMIDARIMDGDIVYIRQQPTVENGEIAAVLIGDEATLKRVYLSENTVTLMACNPKYQPFVYSGEQLNEIRILGKAVYFISSVI